MFARLVAALCCFSLIVDSLPAAPAFAVSPGALAPRHGEASLSRSHTPTLLLPESFPPDPLPALCPAIYQLEHPADCPDAGPGEYAERIVAAGLPYPLPPLDLQPLHPYLGLTPDAYGRVVAAEAAPVYRHPLEALAGMPPLRTWEKGFVFVSLRGKVTLQDATFYEINTGEFMRAEDVDEVRPSSFEGQHFAVPPGAAVGWIITGVRPSAAPGQPPDPAAAYAGRYQPIQVFGVQRVGEWDWYLIGPNQWVEQRHLALVQPSPPAGAEGSLIVVDTYEQTMGVYQNGGLIFATLVSSGSRYFPTRPGTFRVWAKLTHGKMSGAYFADRRDYYFLEDVPWILYYDGDRALHGAYWHDNFGIRSSHGCVNLSPKDARWLFDLATVGSTVVVFSSR